MPLQKKLYRNAAIPIRFCVVSGFSPTTIAELSNRYRGCLAKPAVFSVWPFRKRFPTPALESHSVLYLNCSPVSHVGHFHSPPAGTGAFPDLGSFAYHSPDVRGGTRHWFILPSTGVLRTGQGTKVFTRPC